MPCQVYGYLPSCVATKRTVMGLVLGWEVESRGRQRTVHGLILVSRRLDWPVGF